MDLMGDDRGAGPWVVGVALFLVCGMLAGCGTGRHPGPLLEGDGSATSCFPMEAKSTFILGDDSLKNTGKVPVTIDSVALTRAVNLVEQSAFLSPMVSHGGSTLMGNVRGTPWDFYAKGQRSLWSTRVAAPNAVVRPTSAGTDLNLLVITRAPQPDKAAEAGLEVRYHDDSNHAYVWHSTVTYRAVPRRSC